MMVKPLMGWRALIVMAVALFHSHVRLFEQPTSSGMVALFVMSGFFMAMHHPASHVTASDQRRMMRKRLLSIYPVHWLALLVVIGLIFIFNVPDVNWRALPFNALLVQAFIPIKSYFYSFNGVTWFLGDLLVCYMLYPWLGRCLGALRLRWQVAVMAVLCAVIVAMLVMLDPVSNHGAILYLHVCPLMRLYEFALGIVLWHVCNALLKRGHSLQGWRASLCEAVALALLLGLFAVDYCHPSAVMSKYDDMAMWYLPVCLCIVVATLAAGHEGVVGRVLGCRLLLWLGNFALEMYLMQYTAGLLYNYLGAPMLGYLGWSGAYTFYPWAHLPIFVLLGWLMHRFFTQPLKRRLQRAGWN